MHISYIIMYVCMGWEGVLFRITMLPSEEAILVAQQHLLVHLVWDLAFFHLGLLEYSQLSILLSLLLTAPEPQKKKKKSAGHLGVH